MLGISVLSLVASCEKNDSRPVCGFGDEPVLIGTDNRDAEITCTGVLYEQGITTYQYGTHGISCCGNSYALTSQTINLGDYVGQTVTVTGTLVPGYPVEDGPDYLEVTAVTP